VFALPSFFTLFSVKRISPARSSERNIHRYVHSASSLLTVRLTLATDAIRLAPPVEMTWYQLTRFAFLRRSELRVAPAAHRRAPFRAVQTFRRDADVGRGRPQDPEDLDL